MTAGPEPSILPAASAPTAWTAALGRHRTATLRTRYSSTTRHHHRLRRRIRPSPRPMTAPTLTSSAAASSSPMPIREDHLTLTLGKTVAGADGHKTSKSLGCTTTADVNWGLSVKCLVIPLAALIVASAHVVPTHTDAAILLRTDTIRTLRTTTTRIIRTIHIIRTVRTPTPRAAPATITCKAV
jgi:hypothetical protein